MSGLIQTGRVPIIFLDSNHRSTKFVARDRAVAVLSGSRDLDGRAILHGYRIR